MGNPRAARRRVDTKRLQPLFVCDYIVITMKARLVRIGNSRGVRLPKAIIDQVGLHEDIELRVENNRLIIAAAKPPRTGWADAARRLAAESRGLLDPPSPTRFDEDEWRR
jgi:antitoxin MazE